MGSSAAPEDVFVVLIMTSPEQICHVLLCSSHVRVNTAPRGHAFSMSRLPLSASVSLLCSPPPLSIFSWNWWFNEELTHHRWPLPSLFFLYDFFSPPPLSVCVCVAAGGGSFGEILIHRLQNFGSFLAFALTVLHSSVGFVCVAPALPEENKQGSLDQTPSES